jgi:hypothetical protein
VEGGKSFQGRRPYGSIQSPPWRIGETVGSLRPGILVQRFTVVDNSNCSPTRLTVPLDASYPFFRKELSLLPIANSEDLSGPSCVRVPARVLFHPLSGAALAFFLAPAAAFPLQSRSCAHHGAPSAQATHPTGLPFLPSRLHSFAECETCLCISTPWGEMKSRRGAPKRVNTAGYACPNAQCPYCGITDVQIHAAFWRWQAGPC